MWGLHETTRMDAHTPAELLNWVLDRGGIEGGLLRSWRRCGGDRKCSIQDITLLLKCGMLLYAQAGKLCPSARTKSLLDERFDNYDVKNNVHMVVSSSYWW